MVADESQSSVRRSGRQRKEVAYSKLGKASYSPSPERDSEESDTEFDEKPLLRRPRGRPRKDDDNIYLDPPRSKKHESRSTVLSETDSDRQATLFKRMDRWKHFLSEVPDELLNYSIGWGQCTGNWGDEGGERQKVEFLEQKLTR